MKARTWLLLLLLFALCVNDPSASAYAPWSGPSGAKPGSPGTPSTWTQVLDFDFTAPGSQTFSTDGSVSFGGLTWTKINSASETTHATAGGGAGLTIVPTAASAHFFTVSGRTSPALYLPFTSITIPNLDWQTPITACMQITAISGTQNSQAGTEGTFIAITNAADLTSSTGKYASLNFYMDFDVATPSYQFDQALWGGNSQFDPGVNVSINNTTFHAFTVCTMLRAGLGTGWGIATGFINTSVPPWPSFGSMGVVSTNITGNTDWGSFGLNLGGGSASNLPGNSPSGWGVLIGTQNAASDTVSITVSRLRILYQPSPGI